MDTIRTAYIPFPHMEAEMAAFPLSSVRSFECCLVELDPSLNGRTRPVWREAESELSGQNPSLSLEELISLRDRYWFGRPGGGVVPLVKYVRNLAGSLLEIHGGNLAIKVRDPAVNMHGKSVQWDIRHPHTPQEDRWNWRWITFALPPDLLTAVLDTNEFLGNWTVPTPILNKILQDNQFAEPHLHLGAALDFPTYWPAMLRSIGDTGLWRNNKGVVDSEAFRSPGAVFNEGRHLASWLVRAALARYILAKFLAPPRSGDLRENLRSSFFPDLTGTVEGRSHWTRIVTIMAELIGGHFADPVMFPPSRVENEKQWSQAIHSDFVASMDVYRQLTDLLDIPLATSLDKIQDMDPIARFYKSCANGAATPEMYFIRDALNYIQAEPKDSLFIKLFWQIQRLRVIFYRHVTQRPMTPGLQWFIRFYDRLKPGRRAIKNSTIVQSAAKVCGLDRGLKSLEVRIAPEHDLGELSKKLRGMLEGWQDIIGSRTKGDKSPPAELGVVVHFTKDRGGDWSAGHPHSHWQDTHADPQNEQNSGGYRFQSFYKKKRTESLILSKLLLSDPAWLLTIRGIDVCTDELGVPTWVFVPIFRYVREAADNAAGRISVPGKDISLRQTVHVGEDFIHLATGLRRIDEAFMFLGLREGDRLGHAVALGVEPLAWSRRMAYIRVSRETHLLNLLWEYMCYAYHGLTVDSGRQVRLQQLLSEYSKVIFDLEQSPSTLLEFYNALHSEEVLRWIGFPNGPKRPVSNSPAQNLVYKYLTSRYCFRKCRELVTVDVREDAEILVALQKHVKAKAARMCITVEVNPSSNLLIGNLSDLKSHPIWRMHPPNAAPEEHPVTVCIGSDDPLTFATNLPLEYQYVADSMGRAGFSDSETRDWLDRVRRAGLESRFTLDEWQRQKLVLEPGRGSLFSDYFPKDMP